MEVNSINIMVDYSTGAYLTSAAETNRQSETGTARPLDGDAAVAYDVVRTLDAEKPVAGGTVAAYFTDIVNGYFGSMYNGASGDNALTDVFTSLADKYVGVRNNILKAGVYYFSDDELAQKLNELDKSFDRALGLVEFRQSSIMLDGYGNYIMGVGEVIRGEVGKYSDMVRQYVQQAGQSAIGADKESLKDYLETNAKRGGAIMTLTQINQFSAVGLTKRNLYDTNDTRVFLDTLARLDVQGYLSDDSHLINDIVKAVEESYFAQVRLTQGITNDGNVLKDVLNRNFDSLLEGNRDGEHMLTNLLTDLSNKYSEQRNKFLSNAQYYTADELASKLTDLDKSFDSVLEKAGEWYGYAIVPYYMGENNAVRAGIKENIAKYAELAKQYASMNGNSKTGISAAGLSGFLDSNARRVGVSLTTGQLGSLLTIGFLRASSLTSGGNAQDFLDALGKLDTENHYGGDLLKKSVETIRYSFERDYRQIKDRYASILDRVKRGQIKLDDSGHGRSLKRRMAGFEAANAFVPQIRECFARLIKQAGADLKGGVRDE